MVDKVISGGQTGSDQAALRACGIPTGGFAPRGWLTEGALDEEGHPLPKSLASPWLAEWGLVECDEPGWPPRTRANVRDSDATLWFGDRHSPGSKLTLDTCRALGKPFLIVYKGTRPSEVSAWIAGNNVLVLNVTGNRESKAPGIGARVERFMGAVFRLLGHKVVGPG
jgi:hypothetical protein